MWEWSMVGEVNCRLLLLLGVRMVKEETRAASDDRLVLICETSIDCP